MSIAQKGSGNFYNYEWLHLDFDMQYVMLCSLKALLAANLIMTFESTHYIKQVK